MSTDEDPIDDKPMPLMDHLMELRTRLLWSVGAFALSFAVCYYFSAQIYGFLAKPLADILQAQRELAAAASSVTPGGEP